jgi:hypothetical protein
MAQLNFAQQERLNIPQPSCTDGLFLASAFHSKETNGAAFTNKICLIKGNGKEPGVPCWFSAFRDDQYQCIEYLLKYPDTAVLGYGKQVMWFWYSKSHHEHDSIDIMELPRFLFKNKALCYTLVSADPNAGDDYDWDDKVCIGQGVMLKPDEIHNQIFSWYPIKFDD